jgi:CHAT domain-containing protein
MKSAGIPARWVLGWCLLIPAVRAAWGDGAKPATGGPPTQAAEAPSNAMQGDRLKEGIALWQKAHRLQAEGNLPEAIAAVEQSLAIARESKVGAAVTANLGYLAELCEMREEFPAARKARAELLELATKQYGPADSRVLSAHDNMMHLDRLAKLTPEQRKAVRDAHDLFRQAGDLAARGKYREATPLAARCVQIRKELLGDGDSSYAFSLAVLGELYNSQGDYARAEPLYRQALDILKKTVGDCSQSYVITLNNLANNVTSSQADSSQAEPLYLQVLEINAKTVGKNSPGYAISLTNLAELYRGQGDYARAEPLYRQAMETIQQTSGTNNSIYPVILNDLATMYSDQRDFARAEPLHVQGLEILKRLSPDHPYYGMGLNNLAELYRYQGDLAKAEPLYLQAAEIVKRSVGENHPSYATCMGNLAELYRCQGNFAKAEPLYRQALQIREALHLEDRAEYAFVLNNLASLYYYQTDFKQAEPLYVKALEIYKKTVGEDYFEYATSLANLASLNFAQGNQSRAETLFRQALEIRKRVVGENHPDYAGSLKNLATLFREQSDEARAEPLMRQAVTIQLSHLESTAVIQSERQQLAMLESVRNYLDGYLSIAATQDQFATEACRQMLAWKGIVFRRERLARAGEQTSEMADLFRRLQRVAGQLAKQSWARPSPNPKQAARWREKVSQLASEKERLEVELSARSALYRQANRQVSLEEIQRALPADAALVDVLEYTQFTPGEKKGDRKSATRWNVEQRFMAFVVRHDRPVVRVNLGPAKPTSEAIDHWREGYGMSPRAAAAGKFLREKIWEPIEAQLGGAKIVLVSPDTCLARMPFTALPGKKAGSYLIEDYALTIIPTAQTIPEILADQQGKPPARNLLVVGNIDYDAEPAMHHAERDEHEGQIALRSAPSATTAFFLRLKGTETEIARIAELCPGEASTAVTRLEASRASKAAFLAESGRHRYLHIATHGFFVEEKLYTGKQGQSNEIASGPQAAQMYPALLSGLALAGANRAGRTESDSLQPTTADNGILTAEEIGTHNLDGVELVVLSACETGLGRSSAGEGVLGLQRAFHEAGARTVVASLWKVDDQGTQALMVEFYKNLWQKKLGKLQALRQAQLSMLHGYDAKAGNLRAPNFGNPLPLPAENGQRGPVSPSYWAAFVLSGDWR